MTSMRIRFASVAAACWLAACSRPVPLPVHELQVPVPEDWQGADTDDFQAGSDWWAGFEDSGLDAVVRQALDCSQGLRAAAARVDAAVQELVMAGAAELPELGIGTDRIRQRQNFVGLPFPGLSDRVLSNTFTNAGLSFNVSWEADLWNRVGAGKLAAEAGVAGREADLRAARLSLSGQVAKAWFAATEAQRQLALAEALVEHLETVERRMLDRYRTGTRSALEVKLAQGDVLRAKAAVHQRRQAREAAVRQIEILACEYPAGSRAAAADLPPLPDRVPAGLPSELVRRRPDLVAAERAMLASDARIAQSKAALLPSFSLTTALGTSSNTLLNLVNPGLQVWNYALGVTQPLFNRGRLKANVRATEAQAREASANYENLAWAAYREVETALAAESTLSAQESALRAAHRSVQESVSLAEERYRTGMVDIFAVLALRRSALESESTLLGLHRARINNRVDLHLALGGGFESLDPAHSDPSRKQAIGRTQ